MSITYVDTDILEEMRDKAHQVLSRIEESMGTLRQTYNQMLVEEGLSVYPQWGQAVESCNSALNKVQRLEESISRLMVILENAPGEYTQLQSQHVKMVESLTMQMAMLNADLTGMMTTGYPMGLEEGEEKSSAKELERQTAAGVQAMEIANLMAITQVLKEGYQYDQVLPGMPADTVQEKEEKKKSGKKEKAVSENDAEDKQEDGHQV